MLVRSFLCLASLVVLHTVAAADLGHGQQQPPEPAGPERELVAQRFATQRLAVWQKRLNLDDWHITVKMVPASELRQRTVGNVHWALDTKTAVIRILDPADYHMRWDAMLEDMDLTVVHELIHLELAPLFSDQQRSEANRLEEEDAVNRMAEALLQLERQAGAQHTGIKVAHK